MSKKSNQTEFVLLVAATKFCCSDKDFHKYYIRYSICRCNVSPRHVVQLVAQCVPTLSP